MKFRTDIHGIQRINPTDFDFSLRTTVRLKFVFVTQISSQLWDGLLIFCSNIHGPQRIHPTHLGHFLTFPVAPLTGCFCFTMKCLNNSGIAIQLYTDIYIFQGINTVQMFLSVLVCLTFLFLLKHDNSWMDCHGCFRTKSHDPQRMIDYFEIFKAQDKKNQGSNLS